MALTANRELRALQTGTLVSFPIAANVRVYKGALVGLLAGYARALTAADVFVGIAYEECDNTVGLKAAGLKQVRVYSGGDFVHTLSGVAITDAGTVVYGSADDTITKTAQGNSLCGSILKYEAADTALIRFIPTGCFNT